MKRKVERLSWSGVEVILGKLKRDETLTPEEHRLLIEAQNIDVNRYRELRIAVRDTPSRRCYHGCF